METRENSLRTRSALIPKSALSSVADMDASGVLARKVELIESVEGDSHVNVDVVVSKPVDEMVPWISDVKFRFKSIAAILLKIDPIIGPVKIFARIVLIGIVIG